MKTEKNNIPRFTGYKRDSFKSININKTYIKKKEIANKGFWRNLREENQRKFIRQEDIMEIGFK